MTTLLRLYPRAWRERYGDEMVALLESQPARPLDRLDLILGALDAHLHPQIRGDAAPDKESSVNQRILGIMAIVGGLVWMGGFAAWLTSPLTATGDRDASVMTWALLVAIPLMGIAIGELGTRVGDAASRPIGHAIAVVSVVLAAMIPFSWPIFILPVFGFPIMAAMAGVRGARNGAWATWLAVILVFGAISAWAGFGGTTPDDVKWVGIVFPIAFLLLGGQSLVATRRTVESVAA